MTEGERFLLNLARRKTSIKNFTLTLSVDGDDWRATLQDHDTGAQLGGAPSKTSSEALMLNAPNDQPMR